MLPNETQKTQQESLLGVSCAASAYLIWGLSPIYWKVLSSVPAFEIMLHRIVWSFLFFVPLLLIKKRWNEFAATLKNGRTILILVLTAIVVGSNWFVFIWAINHDRVLQTSLGYYINPLFNVLLGMIFLKERLRPLQIVAVLLAGIGVLYQTIIGGEFPWVALFLAFTFGFYGLIRKIAPVSALVGLSVETLLLSIPAFGYLLYLYNERTGAFLYMSIKIDFFLMGSALVTALPLLFFTMGARRLHLSTLGFLQYIAPSCTFLSAIFLFHEAFSSDLLWTFVLIWMALCIYSTDSFLFYKRAGHQHFVSSKGL